MVSIFDHIDRLIESRFHHVQVIDDFIKTHFINQTFTIYYFLVYLILLNVALQLAVQTVKDILYMVFKVLM